MALIDLFRKSKLHFGVRGVGLGLTILAVLIWFRPWRDRSSPDPDTTGPVSVVSSMLVVHLVERNTDSFSQRLARLTSDRDDASMRISLTEEGLFIPAEIAETIDSATLSKYGVTLQDPGVSLGRCKVLVVYSTSYTGSGRVWDTQHYWGLAQLPAEIPVADAAVQERFEFDFESADAPFPIAVGAIRVLPRGEAVFHLQSAEGGKLAVSLAGTTKVLAEGETAELARSGRAVEVSELPIIAESTTGQSEELIARRDYGRIEFTSVYEVQNLGAYPWTSRQAEEKEDRP
jgi:hypothetical protein